MSQQPQPTSPLKQVLLAVLAHPDDESFGLGGTLALYARRGVEVHLVCATKGEAGEMDAQYMEGYTDPSERRVDELRCAAGVLGLSGVHFLNYRDSGMPGSADNFHPNALAGAPEVQVAAEIAHYFRLLRPQVVITFDPIGGYRHPDHIAIHRATVLAFEQGEQLPDPENLSHYQPAKLYFQTISRTYLRVAVHLLRLFGKDPRKFGKNGDIDLLSIAEVSFPTHARINFGPVAKVRDQAGACHASQGGGLMNRGIYGWVRRLFAQHENYMRAYPPPVPGVIEKDLFEGIA